MFQWAYCRGCGGERHICQQSQKKASKMIVTSFSLRTAILKEKRCCGWTEMNHAFDRGGNWEVQTRVKSRQKEMFETSTQHVSGLPAAPIRKRTPFKTRWMVLSYFSQKRRFRPIHTCIKFSSLLSDQCDCVLFLSLKWRMSGAESQKGHTVNRLYLWVPCLRVVSGHCCKFLYACHTSDHEAPV